MIAPLIQCLITVYFSDLKKDLKLKYWSTKNSLITKDNHLFSTFFIGLFCFLYILRAVLDIFQLLSFSLLSAHCIGFPLPYWTMISCPFNVLGFLSLRCRYWWSLIFSCWELSSGKFLYFYCLSYSSLQNHISNILLTPLGGLASVSHIFHDLHHPTSATHVYVVTKASSFSSFLLNYIFPSNFLKPLQPMDPFSFSW